MYHFFLAVLIMGMPEAQAVCKSWKSSRAGNLDRSKISEASGLTYSKNRPGAYFWVNDSGNSSEIHATQENGTAIKTVSVSGFGNTDWEALATGPCPRNPAESCIYVGDLGDGIGWRSNFKIGVFSETEFWNSSRLTPQATVEFSYPGNADNSEAFIVTPKGEIVILSKDSSGVTEVFTVDLSGRVKMIGGMNLNRIIAPARDKAPRVTDASLSADGKSVLILTYGDILELSLEKLMTASVGVAGKDHTVIKGPGFSQQETLTYSASGNKFIVSSESPDGDHPTITAYECAGI
jgi:hypothetical protein